MLGCTVRQLRRSLMPGATLGHDWQHTQHSTAQQNCMCGSAVAAAVCVLSLLCLLLGGGGDGARRGMLSQVCACRVRASPAPPLFGVDWCVRVCTAGGGGVCSRGPHCAWPCAPPTSVSAGMAPLQSQCGVCLGLGAWRPLRQVLRLCLALS